MTSKDAGIQRCKAMILQYQSLGKNIIHSHEEQRSFFDETLQLFPKNKDNDALYPVEELIDIYQDFVELFSVPVYYWWGEESSWAADGRQRLAMSRLFGYFKRNGPGTPYLKAFSLFVAITTRFYRGWQSELTQILQNAVAEVLNRVARELNQYPSDCASMLTSLDDLTAYFNRGKLKILRIRVELFENVISLCKKYPAADSSVLAGLYRLANSLAGEPVDDDNQPFKLRSELIQTFLEMKHPHRTTLDVLCAWFAQPYDVSWLIFILLPLGLQIVRQMPDRADAFLEPVHVWLLGKGACLFLMLHMPEALLAIEELASPESVLAVECLLSCLTGDAQQKIIREHVFSIKRGLLNRGVQIMAESDFTLVESWQRRLIPKVVQVFSSPSKLTEAEGAWRLTGIVHEVKANSKSDALRPLLHLWNTHLVDNRYSWTHRLNVFSPSMYQGPPRSLSTSNRIWMQDPSRHSATSTVELLMATSLLRLVSGKSRRDPLRKFNVDMILLMTWLTAPTLLERLKTKSNLALLKVDILRRLAHMIIDPNAAEKIFRVREPAMRV